MTIQRANPIGRLLKEKFPEYFAILQQQENKDLLLAVVELPSAEGRLFGSAQEFHHELVAMSDEQLEKADIQRKIRSIHEQDAIHPLNAFPYEAYESDFEFFARAAVWEIEETAALFVGRNPKTFNAASIKKFRTIPSSAEIFNSVLELLKRACSIRQLNHIDRPGKFLGWAESVGIEVPIELKAFALKYNHQIVRPLDMYPKPEVRISDQNTDASRNETPSESQLTLETELGQRERSSLLKLVLGLAIIAYKYNPKSARSPVPKELSEDLVRLGIQLSDDTIRKYLKEASELWGPEIAP